MQQGDKSAIIEHFEKLFAEHGASFESLGYGRRESQAQRFEVMARIADIRGLSILDVCCGLADFYEFLKTRGIRVDYSGIEIIPAFVRHIKQARPEAKVVAGDFLDDSFEGEWDYVFAGGIFYREVSDSLDLMRRSIAKMFKMCRKGVAFNSLSSYADEKEPGEFLASPEETFAFCKTLTKFVTLRHDYMPHDFTIYMYKR
jgi:SAM-dependent methyltransferase